MLRNSLLRSSRAALRSSARSFSSSAKPSQNLYAKYALPSSIISIGLASIYLSQPLFLDSKSEQKVKKGTKVESTPSEQTKSTSETSETAQTAESGESGENAEGNEEPQQQAAYNPETGEINWDCPCLGGMAHGPCGEEFKEAFSCFVYSEAEPKGFDCIEKFKNMQNCFRKYPEIYSEEIRDEEGPVDDLKVESEQVTITSESTPATDASTEAPVAPQVVETVTVEEVVEIPSADIIPPVTEVTTETVTK